MIVLFDYDSMIYKAIYKIASSETIRKWFVEKRSKEWMKKEIVNLSINRLSNMGDTILCEIEAVGVDISHAEYFITACSNSIRKAASPSYKAKRIPNKWVKMVRQELMNMQVEYISDDRWEADDLIKDRAVELGFENCVICSLDKDLKQIPGVHFNYYRPILKNPDGSYQKDENGFRKVADCVGLSVVTEEDADIFFWTQMLTGDAGDGVKGIPKMGIVTASKVIRETSHREITVRSHYIKHFGEAKGIQEFNLQRLLIGLGIDNRP